MWLSLLAGLAVALLIGLINGLITTRLAIPSFIATLGTMFFMRGVIRFVSLNPTTKQPDNIAFFPGAALKSLLGGHIVGPVYAQMVWLVVVALIGHALLNRHRFGNHLLLTGGNRDAAVAVGVSVRAVKVAAFMLCALTAAFAGLLQATRIDQIEPSYATISGIELKAIAAVVVGGTSLFGGRGVILGIVLGAVLIETVDNLLVLVSAHRDYLQGLSRGDHDRGGRAQRRARAAGTPMIDRPDSAMAAGPPSAADRYRGSSAWTRLRLHPAGPVGIMFTGLLLGCIVAGAILPSEFVFLAPGNLKLLLRTVPNYGMIALGVGILLVAGEYDLSVGAVYVVTPFAMATAFTSGVPLPLAILLALVIAAGVGLLNGLITLGFGIPSFITTLGMLFIVRTSAPFIVGYARSVNF